MGLTIFFVLFLEADERDRVVTDFNNYIDSPHTYMRKNAILYCCHYEIHFSEISRDFGILQILISLYKRSANRFTPAPIIRVCVLFHDTIIIYATHLFTILDDYNMGYNAHSPRPSPFF